MYMENTTQILCKSSIKQSYEKIYPYSYNFYVKVFLRRQAIVQTAGSQLDTKFLYARIKIWAAKNF